MARIRVWLWLCIGLGLCSPAEAQLLGNWAAQGSPVGNYLTVCSPLCTGLRAKFYAPTLTNWVSGESERIVTHITLTGAFGSSPSSTGNCPDVLCLIQAGTVSTINGAGVVAHSMFWERQCNNSGASVPVACIPEQLIGPAVSSGDLIFATIECSTGCTANDQTQTSLITITNVTTGQTWNNSGVPVLSANGLGGAFVAEEPDGATSAWPNIGTTGIFEIQIKQSGVWVTPTWAGAKTGAQVRDTGAGANLRTRFPSVPINGGTSVRFCGATHTWAKFTDNCPGGGFTGVMVGG